jgi:diacylglycerol kinase (ATP)
VRISVLFNSDAGDAVSANEIRTMLARHGHELVQVIEKENDSSRLLEEPVELVVAAGGDGTVSEAARVVAGSGIPLAILPLGTANNIARSLGLIGSMEELIDAWTRARRSPFDLGTATGTWGTRTFAEGVGVGLVPAAISAAKALPAHDAQPLPSKLALAVKRFRDTLSRLTPSRYGLTADGTQVTGQFLLVEVLNIGCVGPNLALSTDAIPSDGFFSLVTVEEEHRDELMSYLENRLLGRDSGLSLTSRRARSVEIKNWDQLHIDDRVHGSQSMGTVSIGIQPGGIEVLV